MRVAAPARPPQAGTPPASIPRGVARLADMRLEHGRRWVYSAGFNVDARLRDTGRIDEEIPDLARLAAAGCRIVILAHQGSAHDGSAGPLDHVAAYLSSRLGRPVGHVGSCVGTDAARAAQQLAPGEITILGNTRLEPGEQRNDPDLARIFAGYGDCAAIGGFSKAHRAHASNVGLLRWLRGYATSGLVDQIEALAPWSGRSADRLSVAALGGLKPEKTTLGLAGFLESYDHVIVGGAVLNLLLAARGVCVGHSRLSDGSEPPLAAMRALLDGPNAAKIVTPAVLIVAPAEEAGAPHPASGAQRIAFGTNVPDGYAIRDWEPGPFQHMLASRLADRGGRVVIAGPPGATRLGHRVAATALAGLLETPGIEAALLGGDSALEIPHTGMASSGLVSSGGGAALAFLADGSTAVIDALAAQAAEPRPGEYSA